MTRSLRLLALAALLPLAGCIDFLDPSGLRLAKVTRIDISLDLTDRPQSCRTAGTAPVPFVEDPGAVQSTLCLGAEVFPGVDKFGALKPVASDTLWALGIPLLPEVQTDGGMRYGYLFRIRSDRLAETPIAITYPVIAGVDLPVKGVRWHAAEQAGPDTFTLRPGEGLVLPLDTPDGLGNPTPQRLNWSLDVTGSGTTASVRGDGIPRRDLLFPTELLENLGSTSRYAADLRWQQDYSPFFSAVQAQVRVLLVQRIRWTILRETPDPEAPAGAGAASR